MCGVAMKALMPILGDFDAWESERSLEGNETKRRGNAFGEVCRQGDDAVGLRRHNCAREEAGHTEQDIRRRDPLGNRVLGLAVRGMTGLRRRDQDMPLIDEAGKRAYVAQSRVVLASYTDICIGVKFLSPQVRRRPRKRTQSDIRLATLQLGCDLPRTKRNGTNQDTRSRNSHARDQ